MLLTSKDLNLIEANGYKKEEFCLDPKETAGYFQLRNINGRCFFLTIDGKCSIYSIRPSGCKVYPLVFELSEKDVIIDDDCREKEYFSRQIYDEKQIGLVKNIAKEILLQKKKGVRLEKKKKLLIKKD
jgi:hypothetical protein